MYIIALYFRVNHPVYFLIHLVSYHRIARKVGKLVQKEAVL